MAEITLQARPESIAAQSPEPTGIQGVNGGVSETSRNLLADLQASHSGSMARNSGDSTTDAQAMQGDNDSIKLAGKTSGVADSMKAYIAKGGDFTDAQGQALGSTFISALRQERDDHAGDRQTDLQYAGANGAPKSLQADMLFDSKEIGENVAALNRPNLTEEARTNILKGIESGASAIAANVAEKGGQAGKDLTDAAAESRVISADTAALLSGKLTPEQSNLVTADIASKAGLIQKEVGDVPNEVGYAQNDTAAIKAGADLEAVVKSTMHSHSTQGLSQLAGLLDNYHNSREQGVLDMIVNDRQADLRLEPGYIAANISDNANNNRQILEFSDPFKRN